MRFYVLALLAAAAGCGTPPSEPSGSGLVVRTDRAIYHVSSREAIVLVVAAPDSVLLNWQRCNRFPVERWDGSRWSEVPRLGGSFGCVPKIEPMPQILRDTLARGVPMGTAGAQPFDVDGRYRIAMALYTLAHPDRPFPIEERISNEFEVTR